MSKKKLRKILTIIFSLLIVGISVYLVFTLLHEDTIPNYQNIKVEHEVKQEVVVEEKKIDISMDAAVKLTISKLTKPAKRSLRRVINGTGIILHTNLGRARLTESAAEIHECFVIPATSIKGALSHRFCYHWNKRMGYTYGHPNALTGEKNPAVRTLFGTAQEGMSRGRVIISDVMIKDGVKEYVNSHLSVDRFTGSAMAGALFYEKNIYANGITLEIPIAVEESALTDDNIVNAFEDALKDICCGLLPLGGGVNRGNGVFSGKLMKNKEEIL